MSDSSASAERAESVGVFSEIHNNTQQLSEACRQIIESMSALQEVSTTVRDRSTDITNRGRRIVESQDSLFDFSSQTERMNEHYGTIAELVSECKTSAE